MRLKCHVLVQKVQGHRARLGGYGLETGALRFSVHD